MDCIEKMSEIGEPRNYHKKPNTINLPKRKQINNDHYYYYYYYYYY